MDRGSKVRVKDSTSNGNFSGQIGIILTNIQIPGGGTKSKYWSDMTTEVLVGFPKFEPVGSGRAFFPLSHLEEISEDEYEAYLLIET
jgi:hypothetical protein